MALIYKNKTQENEDKQYKKKREEEKSSYNAAPQSSTATKTTAQKKWYSGSQPTARETYAQMYKVSNGDRNKFVEFEQMYNDEQQRIGSPIYNPYSESTNYKPIEALTGYGFDLSGGITPEWLEANRGLLNDKYTTNSSYNAAAPSKSRTPEQNIAGWYQDLVDAEERTQAAESEYSALAEAIAYDVSRGYSDEQILKRVRTDFDKNYKTLAKMDADRLEGGATILNRAVNYSGDDTLYGMIWAARNDGGTGDYFVDAVNYTLGRGNKYVPDYNTEASLDPANVNGFHPYNKGSNMDSFNIRYGVDRVDDAWLDAHRDMLNGTEQERKDWQSAYDANETTKQGNKELEAFNSWFYGKEGTGGALDRMVDSAIRKGKDATDVKAELLEELTKSGTDYPTLAKMENERRRGNQVDLGDSVDFILPMYDAAVDQKFAEREQAAADAAEAEANSKYKSDLVASGRKVLLGGNEARAKKYAEENGIDVSNGLTDEQIALYNIAAGAAAMAQANKTTESINAANEAEKAFLDSFAPAADEMAETPAGDAQTAAAEGAQEEAKESVTNQTAYKLFNREAGAPSGDFAPQSGMVGLLGEPGASSAVNHEMDAGTSDTFGKMLAGGEWDDDAYYQFMSGLSTKERTQVQTELIDGLMAIRSGNAAAEDGSLAWSWYNSHQYMLGGTEVTYKDRGGIMGVQRVEVDPRDALGEKIKSALEANDAAYDGGKGIISAEAYWKNMIDIARSADSVRGLAETKGMSPDEALAAYPQIRARVDDVQESIDSAISENDKIEAEALTAQRKTYASVIAKQTAGGELTADEQQIADLVDATDITTQVHSDEYYTDLKGYVDEIVTPDALLAEGFKVDFQPDEWMSDLEAQDARIEQTRAAAQLYSDGVKQIVTDRVQTHLKRATALGMSLEEYYQAYPNEARTGQQLVEEARAEYDSQLNDVGTSIQAIHDVGMQFQPAKEEKDEKIEPKKVDFIQRRVAEGKIHKDIVAATDAGTTYVDYLKGNEESAKRLAKAAGFYKQDESGAYAYDFDEMYKWVGELEANGQITTDAPKLFGAEVTSPDGKTDATGVAAQPLYARIEEYNSGVSMKDVITTSSTNAVTDLEKNVVDLFDFFAYKAIPKEQLKQSNINAFGGDPAKMRAAYQAVIDKYPEGSARRKEMQAMLDLYTQPGQDIFDIPFTPNQMATESYSAALQADTDAASGVIAEYGTPLQQKELNILQSVQTSGYIMAANTALMGAGLSSTLSSIITSTISNGSMAKEYYDETGDWGKSFRAAMAYWIVEGIIEDKFDLNQAFVIDGRIANMSSRADRLLLRANGKAIPFFNKVLNGIVDNAGEVTQEILERVVEAGDDYITTGKSDLTWKELGDIAVSTLFSTEILKNANTFAASVSPYVVSGDGPLANSTAITEKVLGDAEKLRSAIAIGDATNEAIAAEADRVGLMNATKELAAFHESAEYQQAQTDKVEADTAAKAAQQIETELQSALDSGAQLETQIEQNTQALQEKDVVTEEDRATSKDLIAVYMDVKKKIDALLQQHEEAQARASEASAKYEESSRVVQEQYTEIIDRNREAARSMVTDKMFTGWNDAAKAADMQYLDLCNELKQAREVAQKYREIMDKHGLDKQGLEAQKMYGYQLAKIEELEQRVAEANDAAVEAYYGEGGVEPINEEQTESEADTSPRESAAEKARKEAEADPLNARKAQYADVLEAQEASEKAQTDLANTMEQARKDIVSPERAVREGAVDSYEKAVADADAASKKSSELADAYNRTTQAQQRLDAAIEEYKKYSDFDLDVEQSDNHEAAVAAHTELIAAMNDVSVETAQRAVNEATRTGDAAEIKRANDALAAAKRDRAEYALTNPNAREAIVKAFTVGDTKAYDELREAVRNGDKDATAAALKKVLNGVDMERVRKAAGVVSSTKDIQVMKDNATGATGKAGFTDVTSEAYKKGMSSTQRKNIRVQGAILNQFAKAYGLEIVMHDTLSNVPGAVNGVYMAGNTLHIGADAAMQGYVQAAMHESTHWIEKNNVKAYGELVDFVHERRRDNWEDLIAEKIAKYDRMGVTLDRDGAISEIVAESCAQIFADEQNLRQFMNTHRGAYRTLMDKIGEIWQNLKNISERIANTYNNNDAKAMLADTEGLRELYEKFRKAAKETAQSALAAPVDNNSMAVDNSTRYSYNGNGGDIYGGNSEGLDGADAEGTSGDERETGRSGKGSWRTLGQFKLEDSVVPDGWGDSGGSSEFNYKSLVLTGDAEKQYADAGLTNVQFIDTTEHPEVFSEALETGRNSQKYGWQVDPKTVDDLNANHISTILSPDKMYGAGVEPNGNITAVFKNSVCKDERAADKVMITALELGGTKLDCYCGDLFNEGEVDIRRISKLPMFYQSFGFIPVAVVKGNPEFYGAGNGQHDIIFWIRNEKSIQQILDDYKNRTYKTYGIDEFMSLPVMEYEEAEIYRDSMLKGNYDSPQFSMNSSIEEGRTMIATHELSTDNLRKLLSDHPDAIPSPSIGIMDIRKPSSGFGNVSLVFDKRTVQPGYAYINGEDRGITRTFSGDAYTPSYPETYVGKDGKNYITSRRFYDPYEGKLYEREATAENVADEMFRGDREPAGRYTAGGLGLGAAFAQSFSDLSAVQGARNRLYYGEERIGANDWSAEHDYRDRMNRQLLPMIVDDYSSIDKNSNEFVKKRDALVRAIAHSFDEDITAWDAPDGNGEYQYFDDTDYAREVISGHLKEEGFDVEADSSATDAILDYMRGFSREFRRSYFESKREGVVGWDEVKYALIPSYEDTSDLQSLLADKGIQVVTFDSAEDRIAKLQSLDDRYGEDYADDPTRTDRWFEDGKLNFSMNAPISDDQVYASMADQLVNGSPNAAQIARFVKNAAGPVAGVRRQNGSTPQRGKAKNAAPNPIKILDKATRSLGGVGYNPRGDMAGVPGARGFYQQIIDRINIDHKYAGNLATNLHEFGHAIHNRIGNALTATQRMIDELPADFRNSYSAEQQGDEAIAEFVVNYALDRNRAVNMAGEDYVRNFETMLRGNEAAYRAMDSVRNDVHNWYSSNATNKVRNMIVDADSGVGKRTRQNASWLHRLQRHLDSQILDMNATARDLGRKFKEAVDYSVIGSRRADRLISDVMIDPYGNPIGDSLARVLAVNGITDSKQDRSDLDTFLLARHAIDRIRAGKPVFDTNELIEIMPTENWDMGTDEKTDLNVDVLQAIVDDFTRNRPEVVRAADGVVQWWKDVMDAWYVNTGMGDSDAVQEMRDMYPNYVPTFRNLPENMAGGSNIGHAKFRIENAVNGGSSLEVISPIQSLVSMTDSLVRTVSRNMVYQDFHDIMQQGGMEWLATPVAPGSGRANVIEGVDALGSHFAYEIRDTEKDFFNMMTGTEAALPKWMNVFREWKNIMTKTTTGSNPQFALKNAIRDFQMSVTTGTWASNYATAAPKWIEAFAEVISNSDTFKEYTRMGGGDSNRFNAETQKGLRDLISAVYQQSDPENFLQGIVQAAKKVSSGAVKFVTLEALNDAIENTSRFAEYRFGKHDRSTYEGRREALMAAQEATTNFNRHGSGTSGIFGAVRAASAIVPFFNATLQGANKEINVIRDIVAGDAAARSRGITTAAKTLTNTALMAGLQYAIIKGLIGSGGDEDEYALLNEEMKMGNLMIPIGGDRTFLRIPIGQGAAMQSIYGFALKAMGDVGNEDAFTMDAKKMAKAILSNVLPDGFIWDGIVDALNNRTWYSGYLVNSFALNKSVINQTNGSTIDLFKKGANVLNNIGVKASPAQLQYIAEQYSGFWGKVIIPMLSGNEFTGEKSLIQSLKNVGRSWVKSYTIDPQSSNDLSETYNAASDILTSITTDAKNGDPIGNLALSLQPYQVEDAVNEAKRLQGVFKGADKEISSLWDEYNETAKNTYMSDGEKRMALHEIRSRMNDVYIDVLSEWDVYNAQYVSADSAVYNILHAFNQRPTLD